ncbi:MAG: MFS transporter [Chlorobiaceae bacterium]|nr:MFS transporter [Chlorobiaceae bacterium]
MLVALYGTSMSLGLATGPLLLQHSGKLLRLAKPYLGNIAQGVDGFSRVIPAAGNTRFIFFLAALVSLMAVVPILSGLVLIPSFRFKAQAGVLESIMHARGPMFAVAMAGVSFFGVSAFISVYGLKNRMTLHESAMLLSCFMTGSLLLEAPLSWVSDFFDRRCFLTVSAFLCMICAAGLPVAITVNLQAFVLLFIWGGVTGAIYPTALAMIGEKYEGDDLIAANAGYALMDATGGTAGILLIGCSMDAFGPDGLPGVIMLSSIVFFSYLLSRYRELSAT